MFEFVEVEYPPPAIVYGLDPQPYGPGKLGAFCDILSRFTYDPRHPRCYCGRFIKVGAHACPACGCDCSECRGWWA